MRVHAHTHTHTHTHTIYLSPRPGASVLEPHSTEEAEVGMDSGIRQTCIQILSPSSRSCVTLDMLVNFSVTVSSSVRQR